MKFRFSDLLNYKAHYFYLGPVCWRFKRQFILLNGQPATLETLEQSVKYFNVNNKERRHWCRLGVFVFNFEHISHLALFLLLTLNM